MPKHRAPYPPEFRQQLIELVWAGRSPHELSKEFEASAQSIRNWVAQAERDRGKRKDGLTSAEREELTRLRHELRQAKLERDILAKAAAWFAQETEAKRKRSSGSMRANQADFPVRMMCRLLQVSASGYCAWQQRAPLQRVIDDAVLTERIRLVHAASDGNYGSPNIHAELRDEGTRVGRKRVARLMRNAGLRGVSRRRGFVITTQRDPAQRPAPDLVNRQFVAHAPNQLNRPGFSGDLRESRGGSHPDSTWRGEREIVFSRRFPERLAERLLS